MYETGGYAAPDRSAPRFRGAALAAAFGLSFACAPSEPVRVDPLGPRYDPVAWKSVEVFGSHAEVQRDFIALGLLRGAESFGPPGPRVVERMRKLAAELGANAIVLGAASEGAPGANGDGDDGAIVPATDGAAVAIRVLDRRWGDRYWRFGRSPEPLRPPASATAESGWTRVHDWRGSGDFETERFSVPSGEWRVLWTAAPAERGELEILVYREADDLLAARIQQEGGGAGTYLGLAGGGTFYLTVRSEGLAWEVSVDRWIAP